MRISRSPPQSLMMCSLRMSGETVVRHLRLDARQERLARTLAKAVYAALFRHLPTPAKRLVNPKLHVDPRHPDLTLVQTLCIPYIFLQNP